MKSHDNVRVETVEREQRRMRMFVNGRSVTVAVPVSSVSGKKRALLVIAHDNPRLLGHELSALTKTAFAIMRDYDRRA